MPAPDVILHGGTVLTLDRASRVAEAVGVRAGRIARVGANADLPAVAAFASRLAMEPEEVASTVSNIHREFVQQAQKATGFSEWANEPNRRERTMEAIHRQVEFGDLRGVKKLAAELKGRGGNYGDEDILSAALGDGVRSYREADGTVMLRITHNNKSESLPWRRRAETSLQQFERWQVFAESRAEREALGAITGRTLTATEAIYVFSRGRITFALNSMRETLERSPRGSPSVTSVTRGPRDPYRAVSWLWWLCRSRRSRHRQGMEA